MNSYLTLTEQLNDGIIIINENNKIEYINKSFCQLLDYEKSDLLGKKVQHFTHSSIKVFENNIKLVLKKKDTNVVDQDLILNKKPGGQIHCKVSLSFITLQGAPMCSVLITQSNNINEFDNEQYKSLVEHNTDHIFQVNKDYNILYINHAAPGLTKGDIIGTSFLNYLPSEESKLKVKDVVDEVKRTGKPAKYNIDYTAPTGKMYFETNVTPLFKGGKVERLNFVTRDVTEEYTYKLALEENDNFLKKVNLNSQNGIYIYDLFEGCNVFSNEQCSLLLGYSDEEFYDMNSKDFMSLFHPEDRDRIYAHWKKLSHGDIEQTDTIVYRFKVKSGEWRWLRSKDSGFEYTEDGTLKKIMGSFIDVTDLINLKDSETKLIKKNSEIENMLYQASHDIKSPINNVAQLIELSIENQEIQGPFLDIINRSVNRLNNLVLSLLDFGQAEKYFEIEEVCLSEVIQDVIEDLKVSIEQNDATICIGTLPLIQGSRLGLYRVFQNLINNALKFKRYGYAPNIIVSVKEMKDRWEFSVIDNGIGIVVDKQDEIFDAFTRLNSNSEFEGSGLGLANCKKIIEKHNGQIWVESNEGCGSTFKFTINKNLKSEIKKGDTCESISLN